MTTTNMNTLWTISEVIFFFPSFAVQSIYFFILYIIWIGIWTSVFIIYLIAFVISHRIILGLKAKAIQQLETTAQLPDMAFVAGMPDLHPGRGYPIGAAFFFLLIVLPCFSRNDIGCGMTLFQTELKTANLTR